MHRDKIEFAQNPDKTIFLPRIRIQASKQPYWVVAGLQLHNIELGPDQYFAIFRQWQGPAVSLSCTVYNLNGDMFYVWTEYNKLPTEVSKIWLRIRIKLERCIQIRIKMERWIRIRIKIES